MHFILIGHDRKYLIETAIQIFYPNESHLEVSEILDDDITLVSIIDEKNAYAKLYDNGHLIREETRQLSSHEHDIVIRELKYTIYQLLKNHTGIYSTWGMLTGIRPVKKFREIIESGKSNEETDKILQEFYLISKNNVDILKEIYHNQKDILNKHKCSKYTSLYIGIPFCPTRCLYCSFTSHKMNEAKSDIYLDMLIKEMEEKKELLKGRILQNIYIGGGTPTSLSAAQLDRLLYAMYKNFCTDNLLELTVEAGRPDTINEEKLRILKNYKTSRISINPQTMSDTTLIKISRAHTVADFIDKYFLARHYGFDNINVDLILGLADETIDDVQHTTNEIIKLNPESITAHTLSVKRASRLKEELTDPTIKPADIEKINKMHSIVKSAATLLNMKPYYLYRQKNTAGNSHNIGYAKEDFVSFYNMHIMEDTQDIIALGAGGISKFINFETNKITRIANVKDVDEYIRRHSEKETYK